MSPDPAPRWLWWACMTALALVLVAAIVLMVPDRAGATRGHHPKPTTTTTRPKPTTTTVPATTSTTDPILCPGSCSTTTSTTTVDRTPVERPVAPAVIGSSTTAARPVATAPAFTG
jgi:hypothetical protein